MINKPKIEIIKLDGEDIILASGDNNSTPIHPF